jgi:hypothetical protein
VATLDRIEPAYTAWSPSKAGIAVVDEDYVGRHRRRSMRRLSLMRMFYTPRHVARHHAR